MQPPSLFRSRAASCWLVRLVFDSLAVPVSQSLRRPHSSRHSFPFTYSSSIATWTSWSLRRTFSMTVHFQKDDLFDYTSGRWMSASYMLFYGVYCLTRNLTFSA